MNRIVVLVCVLLSNVLSSIGQTAQPTATPQPPQSARQALLKMFLGEGPNHLEKHLPEITKKALRGVDSGGSSNPLAEFVSIGTQARAGGNLQTMETGPILLMAEKPIVAGQSETHRKFEVVVERDDLVGDEDQVELSFNTYLNGQRQTLPLLYRLTLMMKMESDVWRLNELNVSARMPLADPDYLKGLVQQIKKKQQSSNEQAATFSLRAIAGAESEYRSIHPDHGFTCSLSELASVSKNRGKDNGDEPDRIPIDEALATGKTSGYVFAITGCDASHYKVAAEPDSPSSGQRAFCADESGLVKFSKNGKAVTCLSAGETFNAGVSDSSVD
jgi:hypothetical protein